MQDAAPPPALAEPAPESAPAAGPTGRIVIDILAPVRPVAEDCPAHEADPFQPEIIVCQQAKSLPPRLTKSIGPQLDDFGNALPRARLKLSENAEAEANLINKSVGGWNANGAEVRLKIDF